MITPEPEANRPPARSDSSKAAWPSFRSRGDNTPSTGRRKICLSLSGGGLSGAFYEIGCLAALDDFLGFDFSSTGFDIYIGVSAGASVAAVLAKGIPARKVYWGLLTDADPALQFRRGDMYDVNRWAILRSFLKITWSIPGYFVRRVKGGQRPSPFDFMHYIEERLPAGLFALDNFQDFFTSVLEAHGKSGDFADLEKELYIPATDLDLGTRRIFSNVEGSTCKIGDVVAASSAIPLLFRPVRIEGRDYIDGSTGKVAHIDVAVRAGASTILIINPLVNISNDRQTVCLPRGDGRCATIREKGMSFIQDQASRIETRVRLDGEIRRCQVEYPSVKLYRIEPSSSEPMMFLHHTMSYTEREAILRYGYTSMTAILRRRRAVIEELMQFHGLNPPDEISVGG
ncbi:MAG TPA: patatin-like phospholipase family protein [Candidatus Eisenbacteria bacterium]|nr:patatin-like phospholipase family protein [Candidatus Eisenbacteria bacterium]